MYIQGLYPKDMDCISKIELYLQGLIVSPKVLNLQRLDCIFKDGLYIQGLYPKNEIYIQGLYLKDGLYLQGFICQGWILSPKDGLYSTHQLPYREREKYHLSYTSTAFYIICLLYTSDAADE